MLGQEKQNKVLARTVATTFGQIGLVLPEQVSFASAPVIKQWVLSLKMLGRGDDREQAYRGLIATMQFEHNRASLCQNFPFVCFALQAYKDPPCDLEAQFVQVVQHLATQVRSEQAANWPAYVQTFPPSLS